MIDVLRNREFRLLWFGRMISQLGSWMVMVAVPAHVFALTGSLVATGLTLVAEFLPPLLVGPFAGVLVDRWDRRRVMIAADALRAVAVALLLFVRDPGDIGLVYAALAAESLGTLAFRPAAQAHTPVLVGPGRALTDANALNAATDGTVRLVGAPLGGLLFALAGLDLVVWLDIGSYALSAAAIARTTARPREPRRGGLREVAADFREGFRFLRTERTVAVLVVINTGFLGVNAALTAILVPYGVSAWGDTARVGLVLSGLGVGFLLGAMLFRRLVDSVRPGYLLGGALGVNAVGFAALFSVGSLAAALVSAVVIGLFGSTVLVGVQTMVQRRTPNAVLGRIAAVLFAAEAGATLAGALAGPLIAEASALSTTVWLAAAGTAACGVAALVLLREPALSAPRPRSA